MVLQTIALIKFFLLNYADRKNLILLTVILLSGVLSSQFISELSLINSNNIQLAFQIEFFRYALILLSTLLLCVAIADDFATAQFEHLLAMPLSRWQYIAAQLGAILVINTIIVFLAAMVLWLQFDSGLVFGWALSYWLELCLVSLVALLAVISLEKIPSAMMMTISVYLIARLSPVIEQIISKALYYSDGEVINQVLLYVFHVIQFILPSPQVFLSNDSFYSLEVSSLSLVNQAIAVLVYGFFLISIMLFDFYRKEFALNK